VEGHVEAATEEDGFHALAENGVVTESLTPDPKPLNLADELPKAPEFADALESAFDSSSTQVDFDALTERYHGKKVWVIDRDKIRRRTAQVIDAALALSALHGEGHGQVRERINSALEGMFSDNRNLATERNAESVAGIRFSGGAAPPPLPPMPPRMQGYMPNGSGNGGSLGLSGHPGLENQIDRLTNLVKQAEATLAAVAAAARRGGGGGGGGGRRSVVKGGKSEEQNSVLLEIFKSNLNLVRGMQYPGGATAAVAVAVEVAPGTEFAGPVPMPPAQAGPEVVNGE